MWRTPYTLVFNQMKDSLQNVWIYSSNTCMRIVYLFYFYALIRGELWRIVILDAHEHSSMFTKAAGHEPRSGLKPPSPRVLFKRSTKCSCFIFSSTIYKVLSSLILQITPFAVKPEAQIIFCIIQIHAKLLHLAHSDQFNTKYHQSISFDGYRIVIF